MKSAELSLKGGNFIFIDMAGIARLLECNGQIKVESALF
jgi:hypothetical protein